ncbi:hypothetical protein [Stieleria maiorica]|uniref:hypothetical protein n=1 Tax=Stieleria maiorica TaxID=2795974 RepID=UPI0011CB712E|nr:hypothetical protein [Stieleria maiorica]
MSQHDGESADDASSAPRPCDGPTCRQSPVGPLSPATPPSPQVQREHHDAVCPSQLRADVELFPARFERDELIHLPSGHASPIERPPRG